jgi:hypothetical protein
MAIVFEDVLIGYGGFLSYARLYSRRSERVLGVYQKKYVCQTINFFQQRSWQVGAVTLTDFVLGGAKAGIKLENCELNK